MKMHISYLYSLFVILSFCTTRNMQAQITNISSMHISKDVEKRILHNLKGFHSDINGTITKIKVSKAHMGIFKEEADYGPMWYGETITVNQDGFLITWEYDKHDYMADRSQIRYQSNDWHSSEELFIPYNKSAYFRMYTCRFGGVPPSYGFANRHHKWDSKVKGLLDILKSCIKK